VSAKGIKEKMNNDSSFESLQILKFLLSGTQRTANYISDINSINEFDIKIFSDNVVIAQKVNEEKLSTQIISIINLVSSIQFCALLQFDFWLRGGITIGELYIDNSVVWGTGLVDAYNIENSLANYPRVFLSNKMGKKKKRGGGGAGPPWPAKVRPSGGVPSATIRRRVASSWVRTSSRSLKRRAPVCSAFQPHSQ